MPTVSLSKKELADLVKRGIIAPQPKGVGKRPAKELVPLTVVSSGVGHLSAELPIVTASEANVRQWRVKSNRTREARAVVSRAFGRNLRLLAPLADHYHGGGSLRVTLTRLGGAKLDALANLGAALKATEDAVALFLGADDGDARWKATAAQETGGKAGVRVEITIIPRPVTETDGPG